MTRREQYLGVVRDATFHCLFPESASGEARRFTRIDPTEDVAPETEELNLTRYEGQAIIVSGIPGDTWVSSASVLDTAGPILTAVVEKAFGQTVTLGEGS